jgi:hypothetical protein
VLRFKTALFAVILFLIPSLLPFRYAVSYSVTQAGFT